MTGTIAVLDMGKTNVKLNAVGPDGTVVETRATPNVVVDGHPWRRHDLSRIEAWLLPHLAELCARYAVRSFVASGHGSAGVLVRAAEIDEPEPALPMIDYEQALPGEVAAAYDGEAGPFFDRGSAMMLGATHQARQMLWVERERPAEFARADAFLGVPQYWAWRLSGVASGEVTYLGAQSHLWNVPERRPSAIVTRRGWQRLMPRMRHAGAVLGPVREALARRYGLPADLLVHTGLHDSSANFHRYQAAGLTGFTLVSTGTWIVAMREDADPARLDEHRGMTCNADVEGRPLGGCLTMGGREFSAVGGEQPEGAVCNIEVLARLVEDRAMALPSFFRDDGLFPGSAGQGRFEGRAPRDAPERLALAVLYVALLTRECVEALGPVGQVVLDGSFLRDPLYAPLVAALLPGVDLRFNRRGDGIAGGAALVTTGRGGPADGTLHLERASPPGLPPLAPYAGRWRQLASKKEEPR